MTENIYIKAQLLADAISASEELAELKKAEKLMFADREAQQIIADFHDLQEELMNKSDGELTEEEAKIIEAMEAKIENHPVIAAYLNAQDNFTAMLDKINAILAAAIAGEDKNGCGCGPSGCPEDCCC